MPGLTPTAAAMRACCAAVGFESANIARRIDQTTGLPELISALEWYVENDDTDCTSDNSFWLVGKQRAIDALAIAREGRR